VAIKSIVPLSYCYSVKVEIEELLIVDCLLLIANRKWLIAKNKKKLGN